MKLVSEEYFVDDEMLEAMLTHRARHEAKGNGFGFHLVNVGGVAKAITTSSHHWSEENFIGYKFETDLPN